MSDTHLKPMPYRTSPRRSAQLSFGTIQNTPDAADGAIVDELNVSSLEHPVLSARRLYHYKRVTYPGTKAPVIGSDGHQLFACNGTTFCYGFNADGTPHVVPGMVLNDTDEFMPKRVVVMYRTIVVYPDKIAYNAESGQVFRLDAKLGDGVTGTADSTARTVTFTAPDTQAPPLLGAENDPQTPGDGGEGESGQTDGEGGESPQEGTTRLLDVFSAGDVVTITASGRSGGGGTPIEVTGVKTFEVCIKEIVGNTVSFEQIDVDGAAQYDAWPFYGSYTWTVTKMERTAPVLETVCSVGNRVFGTIGNRIYASRLGDVTNWQSFQGISTDSWFLDTGSAEPFTASAVVGGKPVFFTETRAVVLYGSLPSNYSTSEVLTHGVMEGAQASLVAADGYLYYLSLFGLCRFSISGGAAVISDDLGVNIDGCISATDGRSILFACRSGAWLHNYRLDLKSGIFSREDDRPYTSLCRLRGAIYGIEDAENAVEYYLWRMVRDGDVPDGWTQEDYMDVQVDFAPFREDAAAGTAIRDKSASKLVIRYDAYAAPVYVSVQLGADQPPTTVWSEEMSMGPGVAVIPLPRNRSDGVRVSISSVIVPGARFRLLGMVREYSYYNKGGA